jgi:hypothetical protein
MKIKLYRLAFHALTSEFPRLLLWGLLLLAFCKVQVLIFEAFALSIADVLQSHCHEAGGVVK